MIRQHQVSVILPDFLLGERSFAELEDERCFALVHLRFEAAFVEWSTEGVEAGRVAISAECD
jgi:hypothetical protein